MCAYLGFGTPNFRQRIEGVGSEAVVADIAGVNRGPGERGIALPAGVFVCLSPVAEQGVLARRVVGRA